MNKIILLNLFVVVVCLTVMFGTMESTSVIINKLQNENFYEYGATWIITNFNDASITSVNKDSKSVYIHFKANNKQHRIMIDKQGIKEEY